MAAHPKGLFPLLALTAGQRFSLYGLKALLVLYMVKGLALTDMQAGQYFGLFIGFVFTLSIPGGYLADKYLGYRNAVVISCGLMSVGQGLLCVPSTDIFFIGLAVFAFGAGLFEPSVTVLLGNLYAKASREKERGYTLFFVSINVGALFAPLLCGFAAAYYSWQLAFLISAFGTVLGLLISAFLIKAAVKKPKAKKEAALSEQLAPVSAKEWPRIATVCVLAFFMIFFAVAFEQGWSSLTLYADRYTQRTFFAYEIPATFFQAINPALVILIGPLLARFFLFLNRRGREPKEISKMVIGLAILALSFLVMVFPAMSIPTDGEYTSPLWLIGCVSLATIAELSMTPIGLALVSKISPEKRSGLMMGIWVLSYSIGGYLAGLVAGLLDSLGSIENFFYVVAAIGGSGALLLWIVRRRLQDRIDAYTSQS